MASPYIHLRKSRKIHLYQQLEYSDCGYACIRMICRYYGWRVPLEFLREISDYNRLGLSIVEIEAILKKLGFNCKAVKVRFDEVKYMPLPSILFWKNKHFVVLGSINQKRGKYEILDPAEGRVHCDGNEFAENFISGAGFGIALVLEDTDKFYDLKKSTNKSEPRFGLLKMLNKSLCENKKTFLIVSLFTLIALIADILIPFIFQRTIDDGIRTNNVQLVWILVLGQFFVFLGNYASNGVIEFLLTKLGLKISIEMLNEYLNKLVRLPMSFYARKVNSDLIQKAEDHNRIKNFLLALPNTFFFSIISVIIFSGLLLYFNFAIFCIFIAFSAINLIWTTIFLNNRKSLDSSIVAKISENRNNLYELIEGIEEIKSNNAHVTRVKIWRDLQDKINKLAIKSTFLKLYQAGGNTFLTRLRDIVILGICATLVIRGDMTIGIMMTISYIVGRLSVPFASLFDSINQVQDASMSFDRIVEIHDKTIETKDVLLSDTLNDIHFESVYFKYPGASSNIVLNNVDFTIPIGKTTAIVGSSGSGKSTIIKLLMQSFKPISGIIKCGETDINTVNEFNWSEKIAAVLQNGKIFSGTILSNVALSDEFPNVDRAMEAIKVACIDDFIKTLPLGIHSRIGKTGLDLSGGQQQRILLARAIYRNPEILILDEATSSLDAITEARIMRNVYEAFMGKTLVIAAHRLSTIRNADQICVIKNGHIVETGKHTELLNLKGSYYNLVNNQM
jgi:ATP-binding cassette subfamily B protein